MMVERRCWSGESAREVEDDEGNIFIGKVIYDYGS